MSFIQEQIKLDEAPKSLVAFHLPEEQNPQYPEAITLKKIGDYTPSPRNWEDEVLYFLLPDRFSDEEDRNLLQRDLDSIKSTRTMSDWWKKWTESGKERFQGGTIKGIQKRLDYLKKLGVSTIWIGPIFKQRKHLNTYHGYGVQDFLEVEPRFGTRKDLVELVEKSHDKGLRIVLDIIFNHSGRNFDYANGEKPPFLTWDQGYHRFGNWLDENGCNVNNNDFSDRDKGICPRELNDERFYTKHGTGDLGKGDINDPHAEHKLSDFENLRDFYLDNSQVLNYLIECYKYWIALTDCDGFRIDTLKHVSKEHARIFCNAIKEYADKLGKTNFLLIGEIGGGDYAQNIYINAVNRNLNAALDIGEMRSVIRRVAKGLDEYAPSEFFSKFKLDDDGFPSHRFLGDKHVSVLDDHDHISTEKLRFSVNASPHQELAGIALQLFSPGITCIYYGTEQGFSGPEKDEIKWLINEGWNNSDCFLREAMFGPDFPLKCGVDGTNQPDKLDKTLPGFGPFGTAGKHCFDENYYSYKKIAEMTKIRRNFSVLRYGRQYHRQISYLDRPFSLLTEPGQIVAWSRIIDVDECVCILNSNGTEKRGARIVVDNVLNAIGDEMNLILNATNSNYPQKLKVQECSGIKFIEINDLDPSGFLIYTNIKNTKDY